MQSPVPLSPGAFTPIKQFEYLFVLTLIIHQQQPSILGPLSCTCLMLDPFIDSASFFTYRFKDRIEMPNSLAA
jgi:hypothetical protein